MISLRIIILSVFTIGLLLSACSENYSDVSAKNRAQSEAYQDEHFKPRIDEVLEGKKSEKVNRH